jgi:hypothetical protein
VRVQLRPGPVPVPALVLGCAPRPGGFRRPQGLAPGLRRRIPSWWRCFRTQGGWRKTLVPVWAQSATEQQAAGGPKFRKFLPPHAAEALSSLRRQAAAAGRPQQHSSRRMGAGRFDSDSSGALTFIFGRPYRTFLLIYALTSLRTAVESYCTCIPALVTLSGPRDTFQRCVSRMWVCMMAIVSRYAVTRNGFTGTFGPLAEVSDPAKIGAGATE